MLKSYTRETKKKKKIQNNAWYKENNSIWKRNKIM